MMMMVLVVTKRIKLVPVMVVAQVVVRVVEVKAIVKIIIKTKVQVMKIKDLVKIMTETKVLVVKIKVKFYIC